MSTSLDSRFGGRTSGSAVPALISLVAVSWAAGCGELPEPSSLAHQEASMTLMDTCPSGTCPDGPGNGKGIYITQGENYCVYIGYGRFFCPERFYQGDKGVQLAGAVVNGPDGEIVQEELVTYRTVGHVNGVPMSVVHIGVLNQELTFQVQESGTVSEVRPEDLPALVLEFTGFFEADFTFAMRFQFSVRQNGVGLYEAQYSPDGMNTWHSYCDDTRRTVAFLPGLHVDGVTGQSKQDRTVTTMACRTGAIASCMLWGYQPWTADETQQLNVERRLGACVQAKRAAFFVQSGDYNSYTMEGTPLAVQDTANTMSFAMPGVEAVWSSEGALCLSPEYRRIPNPGETLPALPTSNPLPECSEKFQQAARDGLLSNVLDDNTPLATGPLQP
jgi:hypothetical protein